MPRFAANLSLLFTELPYLDRFRAAKNAGFDGVEILFPYDTAAQETRRALIANALELLLINAPPPNYAGGTPGYAAIPGGEGRFQHDMRRVIRYVDQLRPGVVHIMAGWVTGDEAHETFVRNLRWVANHFPHQRFTIEPLNAQAQPGYFLNDYDLAAQVLDAVDRPNLGLQYDSYHAHVIHGDALRVWERFCSRVFHVQIGAAPDRSEPGKGPIDFPLLFALMDQGDIQVGSVPNTHRPVAKPRQRWTGWRGRQGLSRGAELL